MNEAIYLVGRVARRNSLISSHLEPRILEPIATPDVDDGGGAVDAADDGVDELDASLLAISVASNALISLLVDDGNGPDDWRRSSIDDGVITAPTLSRPPSSSR